MLQRLQGDDFSYFDDVLRLFASLLSETDWPESIESAFARQWIGDVLEFCTAIRADMEAGRWTTAVVLLRPLQERLLYAFAAVIDPKFVGSYHASLQDQNGKKKSRSMREEALGIIRRWAEDSPRHDGEGFLRESVALYREGSQLQHHASCWTQAVQENPASRAGALAMLRVRFDDALAGAVRAIDSLQAEDTRAWRAANTHVQSCKDRQN